MKNIIGGVLLLVNLAVQAQSDGHAADKAKQAFAEYFPVSDGGQLLYATYNMDADSFLERMNAYKSQAYQMIEVEKGGAPVALAKKDLDFFCLNYIMKWAPSYGSDSVKQNNFYRLMESSPRPPSKTMDSAWKAIKSKSFTPQQRKLVDSLCYSNKDVNDSDLFNHSLSYKEYLFSWVQRKGINEFKMDFWSPKKQPLMKLQVVNKYITEPYIRDFFTYTYTNEILKSSKDSVLNDSIYHAFIATVSNVGYRMKIEKVWNNYITFSTSKPAPDFSFFDVGGKPVTLKSLRGKYVYIDVWATWCGPCKKEIPYLTKIESAYENKKIHFVSLSVDKPGDKNKWIQYVKENKLKGIQLMTDNAFDAEFIRKFNITSIPRFILIDPDGKIISADAKRPSDPTLSAQLDSLL